MAGGSNKRPWLIHYIGLLSITFTIVTGKGGMYSNSYISPNSAEGNIEFKETLTAQRTSGPRVIRESESETYVTPSSETLSNSNNNNNNNHHHKLTSSPEPIILHKTTGIDDLTSYKNVADILDTNDVEYTGKREPYYIQPSSTIKTNVKNGIVNDFTNSGEVKGAPQGRSIPLSEPQEIKPSATMVQSTVIPSLRLGQQGRQANPDIQDIITGIVKLLNGNVNVQANTAPAMPRPLRPLSTRINNRGPPRITDMPALPPDFDVPAPPLPPPPLSEMTPPVQSTRIPTPYPFDFPLQNTSPIKPFINGVPIPEQVVPGNKRPGFYRPVTIPPWNRPPHRRPPQRRPIPQYKPLPPLKLPDESISITSEKPVEDILTLDLGSQLQPSSSEEDNTSLESNEFTTIVNDEVLNSTSVLQTEHSKETIFETIYKEQPVEHEVAENNKENTLEKQQDEPEIIKNDDKDFEKSKEKSTSKMDKHSTSTSKSSTLIITSSSILNTTTTTTEKTIVPSKSTTTIKPTSTANISIYETEELKPTIMEIEGIGEATPVLESSIQEVMQTLKDELLQPSSSSTPTPTDGLSNIVTTTSKSVQESTISTKPNTTQEDHHSTNQAFPYYPYKPRPGIVLDDTEYKPGGLHRQSILTARPSIGQLGDIFDVTVSAIQGPGGGSSSNQGKPYVIPVDIESVQVGPSADVITSPVGEEGFVSIDGKRTYLNLFGDSTSSTSILSSSIRPSIPSTNSITGTGYAVVETEKPKPHGMKPTPRRPYYNRRPSQPPVRIDTCIVGDDSTCDASQNEICKTEAGVSACHCRPGYARRKHRDPCRKVVSVLVSLRVDKLYERRIVWANELSDKRSESFQQLSYETERALESAMSMTPFSDEFLNAKVNSIYRGDRSAGQAGVFVNLTLQLEENTDTARLSIRSDIQKHLLGVIQRRSNNVGNSALWVDSPPGSVSSLQDVDECSSPELHDCHSLARCINTFGTFKCECLDGFRDPWADNKHRVGRHCEQCSTQRCNNRGECKYKNGQETCICSGNYYGNQCELDGEVLGVAIGASVAAVIIIGITLVCLVMWSRRWNREQKAAVGSPVFGYMATASNTVKAPSVGSPPYQLTLEDRLRWAQIADVMAQTNHYAVSPCNTMYSSNNKYIIKKPEPVTGPTRPSSAVFGYPTLSLAGTLPQRSLQGTLPPIPMPRLNLQAQLGNRSIHGMRPLDNSSSSEEEDKTDLLGRSFQVPRPKSRSNASIANQSGIYYDVDYEQNEIYKQGGGGIPLSTYTIGRPPYYRN